MRAENWQNLKSIISDALELEPSSRRDYVASLELSADERNEVDAMLSVDQAAADFMSLPAASFSTGLIEAEIHVPSTTVGNRIGIYEIVKELGIGGMGAVYQAERRDGKFEQTVAIKFLRREFNVAKLRTAFDREIAIQSRLVHPNIAGVLDTGIDNGIPYVVMEFIEGLPIDKYCNDKDLDLRSRLKLFVKACNAVGFAHQNLVVHRDLKPSNILVSGDGEPKLLDFGISKLLEISGAEDGGFTARSAMTPQYASPEQLRNDAVTTSSDIYSLSVVLFKLLTGRYPYEVAKTPTGDQPREIAVTEPTAPSASVRSSTDSQNGITATQLRGDLDNIVLKGLRKDPTERYSTVQQFVDDIWRFLDGMPVIARPATTQYRVKKFVRRHRIAAAAFSVVVLSLLIGTGVALWQANIAKTYAAEAKVAMVAAENESENARYEQEKAEKVSRFMAKIISYGNPAWYGEGYRFNGDTRVIQALFDLSDKIDVEFEGHPDIQAELHHKFAETFGMAGRNAANTALVGSLKEKFEFHAMRALEMRKQYYGEWHELVAKDLFYVAGTIARNDEELAANLYRALEMMRSTNPENLNLPYMLEAYASYLVTPRLSRYHDVFFQNYPAGNGENNYELAEKLLSEAMPVFEKHYSGETPVIVSNNCRLAYAIAKQGKLEAANQASAVCRDGAAKMKDEVTKKGMLETLKELDEALNSITPK